MAKLDTLKVAKLTDGVNANRKIASITKGRRGNATWTIIHSHEEGFMIVAAVVRWFPGTRHDVSSFWFNATVPQVGVLPVSDPPVESPSFRRCLNH